MREKIIPLRALAAEARWSFGVALAICLTVALLGCADAESTAPTRATGQHLAWAFCCICVVSGSLLAGLSLAYLRVVRGSVGLILSERRRQLDAEGRTPEHDAQHVHEQLAWAASCYAAPGPIAYRCTCIDPWPWEPSADKRGAHDRIRQLVIAGALCAAEIDRLIRQRRGHLLAGAALLLCNCHAKADAEANPLRIVLPGLLICFGVLVVQVVSGTRESILRWRKERQERERREHALTEAAMLGAKADRVLSLALAAEWKQSHELIATLPKGHHNETLKLIVSLHEKRDRAAQLVNAWVTGAGWFTGLTSQQSQGFREGVLLAASELAHVLEVTIDPAHCQHPFRDGQGCSTCGEDFRASEADDGA